MRESKRASQIGRRSLLHSGASVAGFVLLGCRSAASDHEESSLSREKGDEAEVTPGEDLMQEHGILERVLLVYGEAATRIERHGTLDVGVVARAARIIRRFVEDYHERLEEQHVFPRLEAAHRETETVATLRRQHERGRQLTDGVLRACQGGTKATEELSRLLRSFERMYRPHAAREDTVVFPAFRSLLGRSVYRELGEEFEEREHTLVGEHGFEDAVAEVFEIERSLGIEDLETFTPA